MTRRLAPILLATAACGAAPHPAPVTPANLVTPGGDAPARDPGKVSGPYPTIDWYCDAIGHAGACAPLDETTRGGLGPFQAILPFGVTLSGPDRACAVGLELDGAWYVIGPDADDPEVCAEPGYIEPDGASVTEEEGGAISIDLDVQWHTNDHSASATYTVTTVCAVRDRRIACTPLFVSSCQDGAPAGDCEEHGYTLSYRVAGGVVTVDGPAVGERSRAIVGRHALW